MNKIISIISLIVCLNCSSQNFEGVISYETTYKSNFDSISTEQLFGQKKSYDTLYFKDGNFLMKSTTDFMSFLLWRSVDTMQYYTNSFSQDTIWSAKTNSNPSVIDSFKVEKQSDTLLGYLCNKLNIYRESSTYTYYYNPDFKLDYKHYKNFTNAAKDQIMKIMGSPYLRLHVESPLSSMDMICVDIQQKELSDKLFEVPESVVFMKDDY